MLDILQRELVAGGARSAAVGVVIVDLDHFKNVNDTYGHFAGDTVLSEAARRMQSCMREYDAIGRYGGEEFLVLLPGCDERSTRNQAERMRNHLAHHQIKVTDAEVSVTASFGGTSFPPGSACTSEQLIRRADEALYLAKRLGRNRVEYLPSDNSEPAAAGTGLINSAV